MEREAEGDHKCDLSTKLNADKLAIGGCYKKQLRNIDIFTYKSLHKYRPTYSLSRIWMLTETVTITNTYVWHADCSEYVTQLHHNTIRMCGQLRIRINNGLESDVLLPAE